MTLVFVTGATGYIAQHICKQLIEQDYDVVGSVRSASKGDALAKNLNSSKFSYEIVEDIGTAGAFDAALKKHKFDVVLHTASPFHFNFEASQVEEQLFKPAIEGTKNVLESIKQHGSTVKKVVVTSSYASMMVRDNDPTFTCDETVFNEVPLELAKLNQLYGYVASKCLAEKALWDFQKENKTNFTLSTIHPVYVFGPQAFDSSVSGQMNTSVEVINSVLKLKEGLGADVPETSGAWIDVRDVAKAHLVAFEKDVKDQRLFLQNGRFSSQSLLDIINKEFPQVGLIKGNAGAKLPPASVLDDSKTRLTLGLKYYTLEECVHDTVKQILDANA